MDTEFLKLRHQNNDKIREAIAKNKQLLETIRKNKDMTAVNRVIKTVYKK